MDPVDRYLRTIQRYLPPDERDDIVAELSANIYAAIEDRERELGRPLDDAEREAILDAHGNPVAAGLRYASDGPSFTFGRLLVGPALFPFYIRILAINLLVACIIVAVAAVYDIPSWSGFANIFAHVALQFGIVTIVFASIQRYLDRRSLPERSGEGGIRVKRNAQRVARLQSFSTLVIVVWTNVWLIGILRTNDFFQPHPGDVLVLTPVWHQIALPYVILVAIELIRNTLNLARPSLVRFRAAAIAVESGVALLAVAILLRGGSLVTAAGANDVHEIALASGIDRTAFVSLIVTGIVLVCISLWQLRKMFGQNVAPTIVVAVGLVALVAATCGSPVSAQTSVTPAPAVLAGRCAANALPEIDEAVPHWNG